MHRYSVSSHWIPCKCSILLLIPTVHCVDAYVSNVPPRFIQDYETLELSVIDLLHEASVHTLTLSSNFFHTIL